MNDLINLQKNDDGSIAVSGRELYKGLEIETQYTKWIERMIDYGFEEKTDYVAISQKRLTAQGNETTFTDHIMTLDMAKEIAMIQRSEIGKKIRKYFIEVEKSYKQLAEQTKDSYMIDDPVERAKRWIEEKEQMKQLEQDNEIHREQIEKDKPKVLFADTLSGSESSILVMELAKLISNNTEIKIGQNKLFKWLRENGFVISRKGESWNLPTQKSIDLGVLDIKKGTQQFADGKVIPTRTTKVTVKGQKYFINKFLTRK